MQTCLNSPIAEQQRLVFEIAQLPAELLNQNISLSGNRPWEVNGIDSLEDDVVRFHRIGSGERRCSRKQFKHQNSEGPIVSADVVTFIQHNFRSNVFRRAAECPCFSPVLQFFCESEINQFDIPVDKPYKL